MISQFPKISIVTPSFNQGQYLESTILSVIGQSYPNLEYIIMDGGSTDNSTEIIRKYEKYLYHWESSKDKGQSDAINKGFARATGEIFAWINSDDMYLPNVFHDVSLHFKKNEASDILVGESLFMNSQKHQASMSNVSACSISDSIELVDYLVQPAIFWRGKVWDDVGPLNSELSYCMDWDWFIRAKEKGYNFTYFDKCLSIYRLHDAHKTGIGGEKREKEIAQVYKKYVSPEMAKAYNRSKSDSQLIYAMRIVKHLIPFSRKIKDVIMNRLFYSELDIQQYRAMLRM